MQEILRCVFNYIVTREERGRETFWTARCKLIISKLYIYFTRSSYVVMSVISFCDSLHYSYCHTSFQY
jgi:hypothetical protein